MVIVLEFQNVTFSYSDVVVIERLSLNFVDNKVTAIIGPSGCGKSTVFKLISGLLEPSSGMINCDFFRESISYVFQDYRLLPWLSVYENVAVGLARSEGCHSDRDGLIKSVLFLVNMSSCSAMYPFQLSGGMQQRVGLARALVSKPELLLMDDVITGVKSPQNTSPK
ncbi:ATP-binding cassette domain-containing protein [Endozoicomonas atrinae]|uniref:ATP-binding cassette domain-containing protein n=1 Tax=Endozoicomonas atrinae TaxID=1333660 RepID=UPI0008242198|nr:ATP-binding cassette domain-containing protein [Endozoicomonas atrinae]